MQIRPVDISAALVWGSILELIRMGKWGDVRPHLDHGLVPCDIWICADTYTNYCSNEAEDWCTNVLSAYPKFFIQCERSGRLELSPESGSHPD